MSYNQLGQSVPEGKEPPPALVAEIRSKWNQLPAWKEGYTPEFLAYVCVKSPNVCILEELKNQPSIWEPIKGTWEELTKLPGKVVKVGLPTVNLLLIAAGLFFVWRVWKK